MRDVITADGAKKQLFIPDARDSGFHIQKELFIQARTQAWLSKMTGISKQKISRMCNGEMVKVEYLAEAARALGADEVVIKVRR